MTVNAKRFKLLLIALACLCLLLLVSCDSTPAETIETTLDEGVTTMEPPTEAPTETPTEEGTEAPTEETAEAETETQPVELVIDEDHGGRILVPH